MKGPHLSRRDAQHDASCCAGCSVAVFVCVHYDSTRFVLCPLPLYSPLSSMYWNCTLAAWARCARGHTPKGGGRQRPHKNGAVACRFGSASAGGDLRVEVRVRLRHRAADAPADSERGLPHHEGSCARAGRTKALRRSLAPSEEGSDGVCR